jgi:ubiquinone/menaquinone biosynthesis C-methylase UbiE
MATVTDPGQMFSDGEAYERLMGRWSQPVGEAFLDWLDVPKGMRWLDVGCGNGAFTEVLVKRCAPASVAAIDPSEGQLAYARKRPTTTMAQFRQGDSQALPYADGSFDAVAMALVITFIPDAAKAIAEMARVVRPGGWVGTYMWDAIAGGLPISPLHAAMESLGLPRIARPGAANSQRDAMQQFWEKAGLQSIETRVIRIPVVYPSFDDFWSSNTAPIGPQGKVIAELSQDAKEQLRNHVRERLPIAADGQIAYEAFANAVKGRAPR